MKNVLLVEDELVIRSGIKILLEDVISGYKVMWEASNGKKALDIINVVIPDIVITDIRMPEMNGLDFISLMKEKAPSIPVIVISGHDDFEYVREALKLGVKDYLLKPIDRSELAGILEKITPEKEDKHREDYLDESEHVHHIKEFIHSNLEKELTLHTISQALSLHPNYISQLFKDETTTNLSDYIVRKRMNKAKGLLENTKLKVYDISQLAGYSNPKHFASVFKKTTGYTPQQYRKQSL